MSDNVVPFYGTILGVGRVSTPPLVIACRLLTRELPVECETDVTGQTGGHCQVNQNSLFFDAKSIPARTNNQRLS